MTRDLYNNLKVAVSVLPVAPGVTTVEGTGIDTQGFDEGVIVLSADGDVVGTWSLEESDNNSAFTAVSATDTIGTNGGAIADGAKLGYIGNKRYIRPSIVVGTDGVVGALGLLSRPIVAPVA